jgi:hypothetical protein
MCQKIKLPGGGIAIVCGGPKFHELAPDLFICKQCGKPAAFLCDWKMPTITISGLSLVSGTCDAPMCPEHALQVGPKKHLCSEHQAAWEIWKQKHNRQGSLFA